MVKTATSLSRTSPSSPSETYIQQAMPYRFSMRDMLAFYIIALFWINNSANAAAGGVVSLTYLGIGALIIFLPCVLATAQLGVLFPYDGSLYVWTLRALGQFWGVLIGFFLWLAGVLSIVAGADIFVTYLQGLNPAWLTQPWQQGLAIMALTLFTSYLATRRIAMTQYLIKWGAAGIAGVVALIGLAALWWVLTGHHAATTLGHTADWSVNPGNFSLFGLITLLYLGCNIPLNMGGEVQHRRVITQHLLWGTVFVVAGYLITTLAILIVRGSSVSPIDVVTTVTATFGKAGGVFTTVVILLFFVLAPVVYTSASSRILFAMAVDHRLSDDLTKQLVKVNRHRVPANVIKLQAFLAILFTLGAFIVLPYVLRVGSPQDLANRVYLISAATVQILWTLATIFLFVDVAVLHLRRRMPNGAGFVVRAPLLWASCVVGPLACALAILGTIWYSWNPALLDNGQWALWVSMSTLAAILLTVVSVLVISMTAEGSQMWRESAISDEDLQFDNFKQVVDEAQKREQQRLQKAHHVDLR